MEMIIVLTIIALLMGLVIMNLNPIKVTWPRSRRRRPTSWPSRRRSPAYRICKPARCRRTDQARPEGAVGEADDRPGPRPVAPRSWTRKWSTPAPGTIPRWYKYLNPGKHNPDDFTTFTRPDQDGQDRGRRRTTSATGKGSGKSRPGELMNGTCGRRLLRRAVGRRSAPPVQCRGSPRPSRSRGPGGLSPARASIGVASRVKGEPSLPVAPLRCATRATSSPGHEATALLRSSMSPARD